MIIRIKSEIIKKKYTCITSLLYLKDSKTEYDNIQGGRLSLTSIIIPLLAIQYFFYNLLCIYKKYVVYIY